jgi:hypothetical protein
MFDPGDLLNQFNQLIDLGIKLIHFTGVNISAVQTPKDDTPETLDHASA